VKVVEITVDRKEVIRMLRKLLGMASALGAFATKEEELEEWNCD
jgi:hypothetical protein